MGGRLSTVNRNKFMGLYGRINSIYLSYNKKNDKLRIKKKNIRIMFQLGKIGLFAFLLFWFNKKCNRELA